MSDTGGPVQIGVAASQLDGLRDIFLAQRHVTFRRQVTKTDVERFYQEMKNLPAKRVNCGADEITWGEQSIPDCSALHQFLGSEPIVEILRACMGQNIAVRDTTCWTSIYKVGEYINRHADGGGDIQLILSLRAPAVENGGWLNIDWNGKTHRIFLNEGDLLCFSATEAEHYTDPLVSTNEIENPERVTAIARYFFEP